MIPVEDAPFRAFVGRLTIIERDWLEVKSTKSQESQADRPELAAAACRSPADEHDWPVGSPSDQVHVEFDGRRSASTVGRTRTRTSTSTRTEAGGAERGR